MVTGCGGGQTSTSIPNPEAFFRPASVAAANRTADVRRQWDFSRDGVLPSIEDALELTGPDRLSVV